MCEYSYLKSSIRSWKKEEKKKKRIWGWAAQTNTSVVQKITWKRPGQYFDGSGVIYLIIWSCSLRLFHSKCTTIIAILLDHFSQTNGSTEVKALYLLWTVRDFCMIAPWTFPHLQAYVDFGLILGASSKNVLHTIKNQNTENQRMTESSLSAHLLKPFLCKKLLWIPSF